MPESAGPGPRAPWAGAAAAQRAGACTGHMAEAACCPVTFPQRPALLGWGAEGATASHTHPKSFCRALSCSCETLSGPRHLDPFGPSHTSLLIAALRILICNRRNRGAQGPAGPHTAAQLSNSGVSGVHGASDKTSGRSLRQATSITSIVTAETVTKEKLKASK